MAFALFATWFVSPLGTGVLHTSLAIGPVSAVGMLLAAVAFIVGAIMLLRRRKSAVVLIVIGSVISLALSVASLVLFGDTWGSIASDASSNLKAVGLPAGTLVCALLPDTRRRCER